MATHSSILAWRIPRTEEPGGFQATRSQRAGHEGAAETAALLLYLILHYSYCQLPAVSRTVPWSLASWLAYT